MDGVVFDTCVLVAGLRSRSGASHWLLRRVGTGLFQLAITEPVYWEYYKTLMRKAQEDIIPFQGEDISRLLNSLLQDAASRKVYYLLRPNLPHPEDDRFVECAVVAQADYLVTFNLRDFLGGELSGKDRKSRYGYKVITPGEYVRLLKSRR